MHLNTGFAIRNIVFIHLAQIMKSNDISNNNPKAQKKPISKQPSIFSLFLFIFCFLYSKLVFKSPSFCKKMIKMCLNCAESCVFGQFWCMKGSFRDSNGAINKERLNFHYFNSKTNNNQLPMKKNSKHSLPFALLAMQQKRGALFMQRLVLFEEEEDSSSGVVEYDHHCEGAEIIVDFYKTKCQAIMLKGLVAIRQYSPEVGAGTKKTVNNTTRRTYLNSTFSDASPIRQIQARAVRDKKGETSRVEYASSKVNASAVNLQKLLGRVKMANSRNQCSYSFREGAGSYYEPEYRDNHGDHHAEHHSFYDRRQPQQGYYSRVQQRHRTNPSVYQQDNHCDSQILTKKNSRRHFIMTTFNRIQNTLHVLGNGSGSGSVKGGCKGRGKMSHDIMGDIHSIKERLKL